VRVDLAPVVVDEACDLTMSLGKSGWSDTFLFTESSPWGGFCSAVCTSVLSTVSMNL